MSITDYKRLSDHLATMLTSLMAASFGLEDVYVDIMAAAPSPDVNTGRLEDTLDAVAAAAASQLEQRAKAQSSTRATAERRKAA